MGFRNSDHAQTRASTSVTCLYARSTNKQSNTGILHLPVKNCTVVALATFSCPCPARYKSHAHFGFEPLTPRRRHTIMLPASSINCVYGPIAVHTGCEGHRVAKILKISFHSVGSHYPPTPLKTRKIGITGRAREYGITDASLSVHTAPKHAPPTSTAAHKVQQWPAITVGPLLCRRRAPLHPTMRSKPSHGIDAPHVARRAYLQTQWGSASLATWEKTRPTASATSPSCLRVCCLQGEHERQRGDPTQPDAGALQYAARLPRQSPRSRP